MHVPPIYTVSQFYKKKAVRLVFELVGLIIQVCYFIDVEFLGFSEIERI